MSFNPHTPHEEKKCIPVMLLSLGTSTSRAGPAHKQSAFSTNDSKITTCILNARLLHN